MIAVVVLGLTSCFLADGFVPISTHWKQRYPPNRFNFNLLQDAEDLSQTQYRPQLPFFFNPFWLFFNQPVYPSFTPGNFEEQPNGERGLEATGTTCDDADDCVDGNTRNELAPSNPVTTTPDTSSIEDISKTGITTLQPPVEMSTIKDFSTTTITIPKVANIEEISQSTTSTLQPPVDTSTIEDFSTTTTTTPKISNIEDISKTGINSPKMSSSIEDGSKSETELFSDERSRKKRHMGGGYRRGGGGMGFGNGMGSIGYLPAGMRHPMGSGFPAGGMGAGMGSGFGRGGVGSGMGAGMGNSFGGSGIGAGMGSGFGGGGMGAGMGSGFGAGGMGSGMGAGMGSGLGSGGMGAGMGSGFGGTGMGAGMGAGMGSAFGGMGFGMGAGMGTSM